MNSKVILLMLLVGVFLAGCQDQQPAEPDESAQMEETPPADEASAPEAEETAMEEEESTDEPASTTEQQ